MPVTPAAPSRSAPVGAPAAPALVPVRVAVLGPPGSGKRALISLAPAEVAAEQTERLPQSKAPQAYLLTLPARADAQVRSETLRDLTEILLPLMERRGGMCAVAGLPVFFVLTKADELAGPKDTHAAWLERIEAAKQDTHERLKALLPGAQAGFGGLDLHVWATALQRPALGDAATGGQFGVQPLFGQLVKLARAYEAHQTLQRRRGRAVLGFLLVLLAGMTGLAAVWAARHPALFNTTLRAAEAKALDSVDAQVRARKALDKAEAFLRFEQYRRAGGGVDWTRWRQDADVVQDELWTDTDIHAALGGIDVPLHAERGRVSRGIEQVRKRAELLGLGEGPAGQERAYLRGPPADTPYPRLLVFAEENYRHFSLFYRGFRPAPLPDQLPLGVVREMEDAAQAGAERYLEPVRREVRGRVQKLGGGAESLAAWQQLRDGWLARDAEKELQAWRDLLTLLQLLQWQDSPRDPLVELREYLQRAEWVLPLDTIEVQIPVLVKMDAEQSVVMRRAAGPLELRHRRQEREQVFRFETERERLPERWVFRRQASAGEPDRLVLQPGDEVSVQFLVEAVDGKSWRLLWSPIESRTKVYAFGILGSAPRLQPAEQSDPQRGVLAFGATLRFGDTPAPGWPALFPR